MGFAKITTVDGSKNPNGWIIPFYKQTDEDFKDYQVKFIYASSIAPKAKKGPHVHLKRECRLILITGKAKITTRIENTYHETVMDSSTPGVFVVKAGTPFCLENLGDSEAIVINLANHIWTAEDQDNYPVTDWKIL